MKKTLKLFSIVLAIAMTFTVVAPNMMQVQAASAVETQADKAKNYQDYLKAKEELMKIKRDELPLVFRPVYDKAVKSMEKLEANITPESIGEENSYRFNPETIYDLETIPMRIVLLGKACQLIAYAVKVLNKKGPAAQNAVAGIVFRAIVKAANPFDNNLQEGIQEIDTAMQPGGLDGYPDITPEDSATIYFVADLDRVLIIGRHLSLYPETKAFTLKIWNFNTKAYDEIVVHGTRNKAPEVKDKLKARIHEITLKRMLPQTTVGQTNALVDEAIKAILEADQTPNLANPDRIATLKEKNDLYATFVKAQFVAVKLFFTNIEDWKLLKKTVYEAKGIHLNAKATSKEVKTMINKLNYYMDVMSKGEKVDPNKDFTPAYDDVPVVDGPVVVQ